MLKCAFFWARKLFRTLKIQYFVTADDLENKMVVVYIFYVTQYLCSRLSNAKCQEKIHLKEF